MLSIYLLKNKKHKNTIFSGYGVVYIILCNLEQDPLNISSLHHIM